MKPWERVRQALGRSRFARNVTILAGATLVGQLIVLTCTPVLTRLFDSAAFGVAAVFSSVTSILYPVTSLRYELAIPLPSDEATGSNLFGLSLLLLIPTTIAVTLVTWLLGPVLLAATGTQSIAPYLWLIPLGLLIPGAAQAISLWLTRIREFKPLGQARVAQSLGLMTPPLVGGFAGGSSAAWLILGQLAGQFASLVAVAVGAWRNGRAKLRHVTRRGMWDAAREFRRFPQFSLGSGLIESTTIYAPSLLFAATYGLSVAGDFALATRVAAIPLGLLGQAVSSVYLSEAPGALEDLELAHLYRKTFVRLFVFCGIPVIVGGLLAPWLSKWVFGAGWVQAGLFIAVLAPAYALAVAVSPVSHTLAVLGRLDVEMRWTSVRLVLVVASIVVTHHLGLSAEQAVMAYSGVMTCSYLALFVVTSRLAAATERRGPEKTESAPLP